MFKFAKGKFPISGAVIRKLLDDFPPQARDMLAKHDDLHRACERVAEAGLEVTGSRGFTSTDERTVTIKVVDAALVLSLAAVGFGLLHGLGEPDEVPDTMGAPVNTLAI